MFGKFFLENGLNEYYPINAHGSAFWKLLMRSIIVIATTVTVLQSVYIPLLPTPNVYSV